MKKILLGGAGGVGKTTLMNRFLSNRWVPSPMTIGVQFFSKNVEIEGINENSSFLILLDNEDGDSFKKPFFMEPMGRS